MLILIGVISVHRMIRMGSLFVVVQVLDNFKYDVEEIVVLSKSSDFRMRQLWVDFQFLRCFGQW
jgi:hypothetical protein